MIGGIYSDEHCAICGAVLQDNGRTGTACQTHPKVKGSVFIVRFGRRIWKKFTNYDQASRFLTGLRFKTDEGSFDLRDYQASAPLGFTTLSEKWLELKRDQVKKHSWDGLKNTMRKAQNEWGNRNVKEIGYAEIEDFLFGTLKHLSDKSISNARMVLFGFFNWLRRRRVLSVSQLPDFPDSPFELAFRKTISKSTQEAVLLELHDLVERNNPRIWVAIKWLSTYISIRPGELIRVKEGEIDRNNGFILIPHPKEKKPKIVPLTDDDVQLVSSLPVSFPQLPFFRHLSSFGSAVAGRQFGHNYLYTWWKKACANLGIEGVDLYGGTRHSSVIALGEHFTPEQLRKASMHSTNAAFERYYRIRPKEVLDVYSTAATPRKHATKIMPTPIKP
jgi:integrase